MQSMQELLKASRTSFGAMLKETSSILNAEGIAHALCRLANKGDRRLPDSKPDPQILLTRAFHEE
jgi:hypothetical protein